MQKRVKDSEEYLEQSLRKTKVGKMARKVGKNLGRTVLFWKYPNAADRFVFSKDDEYLKYIRAEYWQSDEVSWIYFMFLNLPIVVTAYFGGF